MKTFALKIAVAVVLGLALSLVATGCTDAEWDKKWGKGKEYTVTLYSGGEVVKTWTSTGKVLSEATSDGYYFRDKATKKLVEVSGTLVITIK